MPPSTRPSHPTARHDHAGERTAARAGYLRIALGLVGLASTLVMPGTRVYWPMLAAFLAVALGFQWTIQRRLFRTTTRAISMGIVDLVVLSVLVHQFGSSSSVLAIAYVAAPVLWATTTRRRLVPVALAIVGVGLYALMVALELAGVLPYAPAVAGTPVPDLATRVLNLVVIAICSTGTAVLTSQLISALGTANLRLQDLSQQDELTGLYNRRYVMQRLADEIARLKRKPDPLVVAMIDLDHFKRVNDEEGHEVGDAVLKVVATALVGATRRADVVARYGGDEFVIVFPNTGLESARAVGVRMLDRAREAALVVCSVIPVSASIGITAVLPDDEPGDVIRRVDEQLYAAKRAAGGQIVRD